MSRDSLEEYDEEQGLINIETPKKPFTIIYKFITYKSYHFFKKINSINFKNYLFKNLQKEIDLYCDKKIFNFEFSTTKDFNKLFFIITCVSLHTLAVSMVKPNYKFFRSI